MLLHKNIKKIWQTEIDAFNILNGDHPLQKGVLFSGSSSIGFWQDSALIDIFSPMIGISKKPDKNGLLKTGCI